MLARIFGLPQRRARQLIKLLEILPFALYQANAYTSGNRYAWRLAQNQLQLGANLRALGPRRFFGNLPRQKGYEFIPAQTAKHIASAKQTR